MGAEKSPIQPPQDNFFEVVDDAARKDAKAKTRKALKKYKTL